MYVLQVLSGKEKEIADRLRDHGIKSLVPIERRLIRVKGAWTHKDYCLIPGYVTVDMTYTAENYYRVMKLPGVVKILGDPRNPSRLSYLEAEWISVLSGHENAPILPTVVRFGKDGKAELVSGVLRSFEGRILSIDRRSRRASFTITLLGEPKEITLSVEIEGEEKLTEAGEDAAESGAQEILQEAT